jgi:uncharacterized protein (DUF697 family)
MTEEATTYEQKAQRLSALRQELAKAERDLKSERKAVLKLRKAETSNPNCEAIINRYSIMAAVVGLLPTFLDAAALTGLQIKMIDDLAAEFGKNYTEDEGRHTLAALTGGLVAPVVAAPTIASAALAVPVVGPLVSFVTSPATAAVATRLIGRLALERFERGEEVEPLETQKGAAVPAPNPTG